MELRWKWQSASTSYLGIQVATRLQNGRYALPSVGVLLKLGKRLLGRLLLRSDIETFVVSVMSMQWSPE
jgi:hypothetical protein